MKLKTPKLAKGSKLPLAKVLGYPCKPKKLRTKLTISNLLRRKRRADHYKETWTKLMESIKAECPHPHQYRELERLAYEDSETCTICGITQYSIR